MSLDTAPATAEPAIPSHDDPVARGASTLIGGPLGWRARLGSGGWWSPVRVLVIFAVLASIAGYLQKSPCKTHAWSGEYQYTRFCYSDVAALYYAEGLNEGKVPYVDHPVEYPPVIGVVMEVSRRWALLADPAAPAVVDGRATVQDHRPWVFFEVTTLLMGIGLVVTVLCSALLAGRRRLWDAALVALAPGMVLHLVTNWDLVAVALTAVAMLLWARSRPVASGLVFGVAIATKLYPLLLLVPLLFLCARAGQLRAWLKTAAGAVVALLVVYVPAWLVSPAFAEREDQQVVVGPSPWQALRHGGSFWQSLAPHHDGGTNAIMRFYELNRTRPADWDSVWYLLKDWMGRPLDTVGAGQAPALLNTLTGFCFLVLLTGIVLLCFLAPRRPRVAQVMFLTLVAFLLTSKVFSPQYVVWLIPLAALARPRWRAFLAWQATEALVLLTRFLFFVHNDKSSQGIREGYFEAAVVLRDLALVWLCALVVREIWRPELDVVRAGGDDDPAGGVLDRAVDARVSRAVDARVSRAVPAA